MALADNAKRMLISITIAHESDPRIIIKVKEGAYREIGQGRGPDDSGH